MSVKEFFGSWFNIQGKSQTGYFLGHEFIRALEDTYSLREIALTKEDTIKKLGLQYLKALNSKDFEERAN